MMRKKVSFLLCVLLLSLGLIGCSDVKTRRQIVLSYAEDHTELLSECVDILCELCAGRSKTFIFPITDGMIALSRTRSQSGIVRVLRNETLQALFDDEVFREIRVRLGTIEFINRWDGFGPAESMYAVCYVHSGSVKELYGYDSRMSFCFEASGFRGTKDGEDNSLFYVQITKQLFYIEVRF